MKTGSDMEKVKCKELHVEFERPLKADETFKGFLQKKKENRISLVAVINVWKNGRLKELKYINLKPISDEN